MTAPSDSPGAAGSRSTALVAILRAEEALFRELAGLTGEQRVALLDQDLPRLEKLAGKAETLATRFQLLDEERARLESEGTASGPELDSARADLVEALRALLREGAVSGSVLDYSVDDVDDSVAA